MQMININEKYNEIFENIKTYITTHDIYNAKVKKYSIKEEYPMVIVEQRTNLIENQTIDNNNQEQTRNLSFEIDILAIDDTSSNISSVEICEELEQLVTEVMQGYYKMQGGTDAKLYNINQAKATKFILHFNINWFMQRNILY